MTMRSSALALPLAGALAALALPAPASASDDSQLWTNASATVKLSDKWRLSEEVTTRFSDNRNGLQGPDEDDHILCSIEPGALGRRTVRPGPGRGAGR